MDKSFKADLHMHTSCSDGSLTPQEVLEKANSCGIRHLSITDHDTISAYESAVPIAHQLDMHLLSGIELSATHSHIPVHVLGYAFSLQSPSLHEFCREYKMRRTMRNQKLLHRLADEQNIFINDDDIGRVCPKQASLGRPHIALAMVQKGYVRSVQEAFYRYIGERGCCYEPGCPVSVEDTIDCIHSAGGLAVLAHPHLLDAKAHLPEILAHPFDGIEVFYARFGYADVMRWIKIAEKRGWFMTGGSDFHGPIKPQNTLGSSTTSQETFAHLWQHYQAQMAHV